MILSQRIGVEFSIFTHLFLGGFEFGIELGLLDLVEQLPDLPASPVVEVEEHCHGQGGDDEGYDGGFVEEGFHDFAIQLSI
jgi:hypothetical protein